MKQLRLVILVWVGAVSCGGETALLVDVNLNAYEVTEEVDLLFLELSDEDAVLLGEVFEPPEDEQEPVIRLRPGERFPSEFFLVVRAFLGTTLVAQSDAQEVEFIDGVTSRVQVEVQPVP